MQFKLCLQKKFRIFYMWFIFRIFYFKIITITKTGTAEWERAKLYRVNRPPLDHVRQRKKERKGSEKLKWSTEQKSIDQILKAAQTHTSKDRVIQIIPLINKRRNERPSILIRPMTNRLHSKLMKSLSASRKSITLKGNKEGKKTEGDRLDHESYTTYKALQPNDDCPSNKVQHHPSIENID